MTHSKPRQVLFLCSGNYYRSRFAEILFNHLAAQAGLNWKATSCGLVVDIPNGNVGPISPYTVKALTARGVLMAEDHRVPIQLTNGDLAEADLIIALKEAEHRPMLTERFPGWQDGVEYWQIHDLDRSSAEEALSAIETHVVELIERLSA